MNRIFSSGLLMSLGYGVHSERVIAERRLRPMTLDKAGGGNSNAGSFTIAMVCLQPFSGKGK